MMFVMQNKISRIYTGYVYSLTYITELSDRYRLKISCEQSL